MIPKVSENAMAVYYYLQKRHTPATEKIAKDLNISRSTVFRAIKELETAELLTREHRSRKNGGQCSNFYRTGDDKHV